MMQKRCEKRRGKDDTLKLYLQRRVPPVIPLAHCQSYLQVVAISKSQGCPNLKQSCRPHKWCQLQRARGTKSPSLKKKTGLTNHAASPIMEQVVRNGWSDNQLKCGVPVDCVPASGPIRTNSSVHVQVYRDRFCSAHSRHDVRPGPATREEKGRQC